MHLALYPVLWRQWDKPDQVLVLVFLVLQIQWEGTGNHHEHNGSLGLTTERGVGKHIMRMT